MPAPGRKQFMLRGGQRIPMFAGMLAVAMLLVGGVMRLTSSPDSSESAWLNDSTQTAVIQKNVQGLFSDYRQSLLDSCTALAKDPDLIDAISRTDAGASLKIFGILGGHDAPGTTYEAYAIDGRLLGWIGPGGTGTSDAIFGETILEEISQGPIFTYYSLAVPVAADSARAGHIIGRTIFDVRYPLSNRFISSDVFQSTFTARLNWASGIRVHPAGGFDTSGSVMNVGLSALDGSTLATIALPVPARDEADGDSRPFLTGLEATAGFLLVLVAAWMLFVFSGSVQRDLVRFLLRIGLLWLVRYSMLWLGIPSAFFTDGMFDPFYFASAFGFGLAKSAGEALISSLALFVTILLTARSLGTKDRNDDFPEAVLNPFTRAVKGMLIFAAGFVIWILLRGVAATVRSAIVDTTLSYTDPSSILPQPVVAVLLITVFLVTISFVITAALILAVARKWYAEAFRVRVRGITSIAGATMLVLMTGLLFGLVHPNPLTSAPERLLLLLGIAAMILYPRQGQPMHFLAPQGLWIGAALAVIVVLVRYDAELAEYDRARVELVASDIARPADSWLSFVVNRALDEVAAPATVDVLFSGSQEDVEKLAFTSWAGSILSREGLNCSVMLMDYDGNTVSRFSVGAGPIQTETQFELASFGRSVTVEERDGEGGRSLWYVGSMPLYSGSGTPLGAVRIEVSATKKAFLRGDAPEILRNYGREDRRTRELPLIFSEYAGGQIIATTSEVISLSRRLPEAVSDSAGIRGVWLEESEKGEHFATYYFWPEGISPRVSSFALSLPMHDTQLRTFVALRILALYFSLAIAGALLWLIFRLVFGQAVKMSFRTKILLTFVCVSVIPLAVMTVYNRNYAIEQAGDVMVRILSEESERVVGILQREYAVQTPFDLAGIRDQECRDIAGKASTDFNLYGPRELLASSRPEVFVSELIDRRLSGGAYRAMVLERRSFYSELQNIGTLEYVAGYRPFLSSAGEVIGVVSVHTLYRQQEVDNEAMDRNSFLFGAYALSCIVALALGLIFSRRISSPIRELQQVTRRIAAGDLDVRIQSRRTDELGELERAFDTMASDLKDHQERIVRTERELAWREMARQVAHEIKNPLTPMKLSVQHLRRAHEDGAGDFSALLRHVTQVLLDQIETLSRIATEFSRFARMPARKPEPCDITDLLNDATSLFSHHTGISQTVSYRAANPVVVADREELRRAFVNILRNAVQAMHEQGAISISTQRSGNRVEIEIADTGPGIPESMKEHLFKPNFSTKTEGMGLGLAIVKKTIDDLQGEIRIESAEGKGTTVRISLPLMNPQEAGESTR